MNAHVHHGLSMAAYLAMPAVSSSTLRAAIERCPYAGWYESWLNPNPTVEKSKDEVNIGSIAHSILLEGNSEIVWIVEAKDWRTNEAKDARAAAIAAGKIPLLARHMPEVEAMVGAARVYIDSLRTTEPQIWRAFQPDGGESEITVTWDDGGVPCRMRPDRISNDRHIIVDYKTGGTSAEPDTWGRTQMVRMGYYFGAAFYRRGALEAFGVEPEYFFLVQEQEAPYLCSLVGIEPGGYELGAAKVKRGLAIWRDCVRDDSWPRYPNRVCYAELPPWETQRWEDSEIHRGIVYDPAQMFGKREMRESDPAVGG